VSQDGKRLYVALNLSNRLAELDAASGRVLRLWEVGFALSAWRGRQKAYVSNWGGASPIARASLVRQGKARSCAWTRSDISRAKGRCQ